MTTTNFDLKTLDLSVGTHEVYCISRAAGFPASEPSNTVEYTRVPAAYIKFSSAQPFTLSTRNNTKSWDGTLEYSANNTNWNEWNGSDVLNSSSGEECVLYIRGSNNSFITGATNNTQWVLTGTAISCEGNIENILDYQTVLQDGHPTMANLCFRGLFYGCAALVSAPELPAPTIALGCYWSMFTGCTSLTSAPALPATTLANYCYYAMFRGCTALTIAPELPATTLATSCYQEMFYGCTALTLVPELPATTLANFCYADMFRVCTNIKLSETQTGNYTKPYRIPASGDGTTAPNALSGMFASTGGTFTGTPVINTTYYLWQD